jgi:hypothetical protein
MMRKLDTQSAPRQMKQKRKVGYFQKCNSMHHIKSEQQVSQNYSQNYLENMCLLPKDIYNKMSDQQKEEFKRKLKK